MDPNQFPERIRYHYRQESDLPLRIAHGVWGGANPHGEIEMCFYEETSMLPGDSTQEIASDGMPGPERFSSTDTDRHIGRRIHTRILLNYNTARALSAWLEDRLAEMESDGGGDLYDGGSGICQ